MGQGGHLVQGVGDDQHGGVGGVPPDVTADGRDDLGVDPQQIAPGHAGLPGPPGRHHDVVGAGGIGRLARASQRRPEALQSGAVGEIQSETLGESRHHLNHHDLVELVRFGEAHGGRDTDVARPDDRDPPAGALVLHLTGSAARRDRGRIVVPRHDRGAPTVEGSGRWVVRHLPGGGLEVLERRRGDADELRTVPGRGFGDEADVQLAGAVSCQRGDDVALRQAEFASCELLDLPDTDDSHVRASRLFRTPTAASRAVATSLSVPDRNVRPNRPTARISTTLIVAAFSASLAASPA